jgi:hypothetical protein
MLYALCSSGPTMLHCSQVRVGLEGCREPGLGLLHSTGCPAGILGFRGSSSLTLPSLSTPPSPPLPPHLPSPPKPTSLPHPPSFPSLPPPLHPNPPPPLPLQALHPGQQRGLSEADPARSETSPRIVVVSSFISMFTQSALVETINIHP